MVKSPHTLPEDGVSAHTPGCSQLPVMVKSPHMLPEDGVSAHTPGSSQLPITPDPDAFPGPACTPLYVHICNNNFTIWFCGFEKGYLFVDQAGSDSQGSA